MTTGPIAGSRKIYSVPETAGDRRVPLREIVLDASSGEPPVYDPSGPPYGYSQHQVERQANKAR